MIKRFLAVAILAIFVGIQFTYDTRCNSNTELSEISLNNLPITPLEISEPLIEVYRNDESDNDIDIYTIKYNELIEKQAELSNLSDKKDWFIAYKNLIKEYLEWCDAPKTIYDYYSQNELTLLFQVIEAEATGGNFENKCNVASVIFNRLYHDEFGDTLSEILTKKQFGCISDGRYKKIEITEDTILACEYVWRIGVTNNCVYFESESSNTHSSYADFQFKDSIGHKFYSERN